MACIKGDGLTENSNSLFRWIVTFVREASTKKLDLQRVRRRKGLYLLAIIHGKMHEERVLKMLEVQNGRTIQPSTLTLFWVDLLMG